MACSNMFQTIATAFPKSWLILVSWGIHLEASISELFRLPLEDLLLRPGSTPCENFMQVTDWYYRVGYLEMNPNS
jgi:hypothetical protein